MAPVRLIVFLISLLTFNFVFLTPVNAQQTLPVSLSSNTNPDVPQNLNTWTQNIMLNVMAATICQLAGVNPLDSQQRCLGIDQTTGKIGYAPSPGSEQAGGAIGIAGNLIAATFTHPPASTAEYLSYMGNKFGIAQPAYAQGTGFNGLKPVIKIWEAFRNLAYMAFVLVFVGIGLLIMLRVKIDPRTVMTIQNSIPRIIIGLVLVTFTFAIAGFFIDLMYVSIYLIFGLFQGMEVYTKSGPFQNSLNELRSSYQQGSVFAFNNTFGLATLAKDIAGTLKDYVTVTLGGQPQGPSGGTALVGALGLSGFATGIALIATSGVVGAGVIITAVLTLILGGFIGSFAPGGQEIIGAGAGLIAFLIIAITILWTVMRLGFQLLLAYIWLLLDIVTAPLWIVGGMFPGSPMSFSMWLRDVTSHLSAYPATIFMFLLAKAFMEGFGDAASSGSAFVPPLIGPQSVDALKAFIGFGVLLLTPQIVTMVKDAFKAPKFPYGAAVGQALGVGAGVGTGVASQFTSPYSFYGGLKQSALGRAIWKQPTPGIEPQVPFPFKTGSGKP